MGSKASCRALLKRWIVHQTPARVPGALSGPRQPPGRMPPSTALRLAKWPG
jgi:hypothetical protein